MSSCSIIRGHIKLPLTAITVAMLLLITMAGSFAAKSGEVNIGQAPKWNPLPSKSPSQDKPVELFFADMYLSVPFELLFHERLVLGYAKDGGCGFPKEAFLHLFYVTFNHSEEIKDLNQLKGKVKIDSPEDALAFVRLKTSPITWYLWGRKSAMEVVSMDQVDLKFCFGDENEYRCRINSNCSGMYGVVKDKSDLDSMKIKRAEVKATKTGFEIHRTLLTEGEKWCDNYIYEVTEFVGSNGSYSVREGKLRKAPKTDNIMWILPIYM